MLPCERSGLHPLDGHYKRGLQNPFLTVCLVYLVCTWRLTRSPRPFPLRIFILQVITDWMWEQTSRSVLNRLSQGHWLELDYRNEKLEGNILCGHYICFTTHSWITAMWHQLRNVIGWRSYVTLYTSQEAGGTILQPHVTRTTELCLQSHLSL